MQTPNSSTSPAPSGADALPTTVRAVTQDRYGGTEVLALSDIRPPTPADDEVLIEVAAAGLDRGVWHLMTGRPWLVRLVGFGVRRPKRPVLGSDLAGRVVQVGSAVTRFAVGDEVMGIGRGAFAELAVAPEAKLVHRPENVVTEQAAVSTISGITALQALTTIGRVQPGQRVLVIGASGGVGSFAVQLAVALGASVTGVAGPTKLDAVRALGAEAVVDHTRHRIDEIGRFDLIIDTGGRNPLRRLRRALTSNGTLVIVGGEGGNRVTGGFGRSVRAQI